VSELVYRLFLLNVCILSQNVGNYDMPQSRDARFHVIKKQHAFGLSPFKDHFWESLFYAGVQVT